MKTRDKVINHIDNGYGIVQLMAALELEKKDIVALAEADEAVCRKLKKRFVGVDWIEKIEYKGVTLPASDNDTPELAALKAEAKELGIQFNPNIGAEKLKARIAEFKSGQPASDN